MSYLVMELLNGQPLSEELRATGALDPVRALQVMREVANGLAFAHAQGIIHRDIKPDNIVILDDHPEPGFAKILDLGIASSSEEPQEGEPTLYGTPEYMAPEHILGHSIDVRVDVYAAGVTLFELLTGRCPFTANTVPFLLAQHVTAEPPKLAELRPELGDLPELQQLVDACLVRDPAKRLAGGQALLVAIDRVLDTLGGASLVGQSGGSKPRRSLRAEAGSVTPSAGGAGRKRRFGVVLMILLGVALSYLAWRLAS
jgi:serine/threonine-protein kinase